MCKNFIKYTALICNYLYHFKITSDTLYLVKVCWLTVVTYVICSRNCVTPCCTIWLSALLANVSIFRPYDSHCLASTRTVMNLFIWTNTYLSQIVHCMLRFFIHVDVFSMYLPACPLSLYHHMLWHLCIFEMEGAFLLSLTKTMPKTNTIEIAFKYLLLSIEKLD